MENTANNTQKREELTIKFGKGLVGKPFTAKTGKECVSIKIPNPDPADKTPWESIVVGANHVHEDKFGKGMWMKPVQVLWKHQPRSFQPGPEGSDGKL